MTKQSFLRHRRLRQSANLRALVKETTLSVDDLIYPLFITETSSTKVEVPSMPGIYQLPLDHLPQELDDIVSVGIKAVILFGIPLKKDAMGTEAYAESGIIQEATRRIKQRHPSLLVITDTCLCEYTSHGHCGVIVNNDIDNDQSLQLIAKTAVTQAKAGADIIAPSNMMDGFTITIRRALDEAGYSHIPIMSYAVKYASSFYGPFRDAAESTPQFGDRKTYQMDPANRREALKEVFTDVDEGADILIVKPALAYLDIVRDVKDQTNIPIVAYSVSGEYSMIKAAAERDWIDELPIATEMLKSMKRAGADLIITYYAKQIAQWLKSSGKGIVK